MFGQGEVVIRRRGESYRLCLPVDSTVDVCAFSAAITRADALSARGDMAGRVAARQEALDLYAGDLLPEITGSTHIASERDRLRRSAAAAAAALASDFRTLGDYEQALVMARRSVQLDPYQEIPWLILADVHDKLGDVSSAEYVRREHARVRAELEIAAP
jgi:two-component SAPR family response regulator